MRMLVLGAGLQGSAEASAARAASSLPFAPSRDITFCHAASSRLSGSNANRIRS